MDNDFEHPDVDALIQMQAQLLSLYGGAPGLRDEGALEAALARPRNLLSYGDDDVSVPRPAAAIAYSLCRIRHPFVDGNKRIAFAALVVTLDMNGYVLDASEKQAADTVIAVASGEIGEDDFVAWVTANSVPASYYGSDDR